MSQKSLILPWRWEIMKKVNGVSFFVAVIIALINPVFLSAGNDECHGLYSPGNSYGCGIGNGNCTWYAAYRRPDLNFPIDGRNAGTWIEHAKNFGFVVGDLPVSGAVAVVNMGEFGHVVYVEDRY